VSKQLTLEGDKCEEAANSGGVNVSKQLTVERDKCEQAANSRGG
jgi:hypothetical protein